MARSLEVLRAEINQFWPNRDRTSDGGVGDADHASRSSDHNPWVKDSTGVGVVRARDFDEDGIPADRIVAHLVRLGAASDPRLANGGYVIYEGRIAGAGKGWAWRPYTGQNAHAKHFHVSVSKDQAGYDSTRTWNINEEDEVTPEEIRTIVREEVSRAYTLLMGGLRPDGSDADPGHSSIVDIHALLKKVAAKIGA